MVVIVYHFPTKSFFFFVSISLLHSNHLLGMYLKTNIQTKLTTPLTTSYKKTPLLLMMRKFKR